jgi:hypothetical protein
MAYKKSIDKEQQITNRSEFIKALRAKGLVNKAIEVLALELENPRNRQWAAEFILEQSFGKASQAYDNGIPTMQLVWDKKDEK